MSKKHSPSNKSPTLTKSLGFLKKLLVVLLAAEFPLLVYWTANLGQVRPSVADDPLLWIAAAVLILFSLLSLILRNSAKSALMTLLFILLFFTYGHLMNLIEPAYPNAAGIISGILLALYALAFLVSTFLILRAKKQNNGLFNYLLVIFALLAGFNIGKILLFDPRVSSTQVAPSVVVNDTSTSEKSPDVYIIILDSYARADLLKQHFDYDNSPFLEALKERGFYIPDCAYSNYERTHISVPVILNMDYADKLGIPDSELDTLTPHQVDLILNNEASTIFRGMGYQFVAARGYGAFDDFQNADIYLNYYSSQGKDDELAERNFLYLFIRTTLLRAYFQPAASTSSAPVESAAAAPTEIDTSGLGYEEAFFWYNQTNYVFDSLAKLPQTPGKYFVYAHINAPHSPYVFYPDGSFHFVTDYSDEKTLYTDAVTYLNKRVLELVDALIANSEVPPVIIIQADHGPHLYENGIDHHKILSAYYLPGDIDLKPYPAITQVNDLRIVLHDYFDPSVELLPDMIYLNEGGVYTPVPADCNLK
jgi:hypothetical protein